jgi:2-phosphoglycerate kinase
LRNKILLIGGPSGTGKTILSQSFAAKSGWSTLQVDDIRLAVQAIATQEQNPDLHRFTNPNQEPLNTPQKYADALLNVAEILEPAIRIIMAHHLHVESAGSLIIEGDGILPHLGSTAYLKSTPVFSNLEITNSIHAVFLVPNDIAALENAVLKRGRGAEEKPKKELQTHIEGSYLYGQHLAEQAKKASIPTVNAYPFETLYARAAEMLPIESIRS